MGQRTLPKPVAQWWLSLNSRTAASAIAPATRGAQSKAHETNRPASATRRLDHKS